MPSQEKKDKVKQIKKWFDKSESLLLLRYKGLTVSEANELRERMKDMDSELRVLKNTLTRIALADTPNEPLSTMFEGPVAVVFVKQDAGHVARTLRDFGRGRPDFHLLGGMVEGRALTGGQVEAFAALPAREVLLAQMLGTLKAPIATAVGVGASVIRKMLAVFQAVAEKAPAAAGRAEKVGVEPDEPEAGTPETPEPEAGTPETPEPEVGTPVEAAGDTGAEATEEAGAPGDGAREEQEEASPGAGEPAGD